VVGVPIGNGGGGSDAFVLRYVPLFGTVDTVTPVATGSGNGKAKGIGATSTGYVAVGLFSGTATFGKTAPPSLTTPGDNDGFIYAV
jgi:hypothetical protein